MNKISKTSNTLLKVGSIIFFIGTIISIFVIFSNLDQLTSYGLTNIILFLVLLFISPIMFFLHIFSKKKISKNILLNCALILSALAVYFGSGIFQKILGAFDLISNILLVVFILCFLLELFAYILFYIKKVEYKAPVLYLIGLFTYVLPNLIILFWALAYSTMNFYIIFIISFFLFNFLYFLLFFIIFPKRFKTSIFHTIVFIINIILFVILLINILIGLQAQYTLFWVPLLISLIFFLLFHILNIRNFNIKNKSELSKNKKRKIKCKSLFIISLIISFLITVFSILEPFYYGFISNLVLSLILLIMHLLYFIFSRNLRSSIFRYIGIVFNIAFILFIIFVCGNLDLFIYLLIIPCILFIIFFAINIFSKNKRSI